MLFLFRPYCRVLLLFSYDCLCDVRWPVPINKMCRSFIHSSLTNFLSLQRVPDMAVEIIIAGKDETAWVGERHRCDTSIQTGVLVTNHLLVRAQVIHLAAAVIWACNDSIPTREELKWRLKTHILRCINDRNRLYIWNNVFNWLWFNSDNSNDNNNNRNWCMIFINTSYWPIIRMFLKNAFIIQYLIY